VTGFPEPSGETADTAELLARYLDFYRAAVVRKVASLAAVEQRSSRLPSGWTPVELLHHLAHMERRWLVWGFLGESMPDPWAEERDGRWHVPDDLPLESVVDLLTQGGSRTSDVLAAHALSETGVPGGRFEGDPPTLAWICFHVLQEYARHAGQLDVAVELAGGDLGE